MKKLILLVVFFLSVVGHSQVIIYTSCQYSGQSSTLTPGNYYNAFQFRLADNSVSSLRIPVGFRVELYDNINLMGTPRVFTGNISCLSTYDNNRASSIRVTYSADKPGIDINPNNGVGFFTACDFRGRNEFLPPGDYPRLRDVIGSDIISSLRVPPGMVVELYSDEFFRGNASGKVTTNQQCIGNFWKNSALSARIYYEANGGWIPPAPPTGGYEGMIRVFNGCNYWGTGKTFSVGVYDDFTLSAGSQTLGSMQISPGVTVELYSGPRLTGSVLGRYTSNQSCLPVNVQFFTRSARIYTTGSSGGNWNGRDVMLYADCQYRGRTKTLTAGRYPDLNQIGGFSPAGLRLAPGFTAEFFERPNFQGASSGRITENLDCFSTYWRNRARSAIITFNASGPEGYEDVVVYSECYFNGRSKVVNPGYYNNLSLIVSNTVVPASVRIPQGFKVELFEDNDFKGQHILLTNSNNCLPATWKGRAKSMIVTYNDHGGGNPWDPVNNRVVAHSECYFNGQQVTLDAGEYIDVSYALNGMKMNISSLKIPSGYVVELYQRPRFEGLRTVLTGDNTCLSANFRGKVGSMKIVREVAVQPK
jgi:hypothetical protein